VNATDAFCLMESAKPFFFAGGVRTPSGICVSVANVGGFNQG
jgi:hypothetical protein